MRILYWTELFWPYIGGLEVFSTRLLTELRARGHEVLVVTSHTDAGLPDADVYRGVPVRRFPFTDALVKRDLSRIVAVRRQVVEAARAFAPDVLHAKMTSLAPTTLFQLETARLVGVPVLVTLQGAVNGAAAHPETLHGSLLRRANWVTAVSSATLAGARSLVPEIVGRSSVIYNGLEAPAMAPSALPREPPRILCLGRHATEKGFDVALAAFAAVSRPDARLIVAGDGLARPSLESMAAGLGLASRVEFPGWIPPERVPSLMNTASMVVVPSREEAFGIVALEAAAMARPVVATRVGGLPEVVVHGQTGLLVQRDDPGALGAAMVWLLEHPHAAERMGHAARRRAIREFTLDAAVDAYVNLYGQLTGEATHAAAADSIPRQ